MGSSREASASDKAAASSRSEPPAPTRHISVGEFRAGLRTLILSRIVLLTFLLVATALFNVTNPAATNAPGTVSTVDGVLYGLVAGMYLLSALYAFALRLATGPQQLEVLAYTQLSGDAVFAAMLVLITGGSSSVFTFFFSLSIVLAAVILYRPGAVFLATVSSILLALTGLVEIGAFGADNFLTALMEEGAGHMEPLNDEAEAATYGSVAYNLVVNVVAFYAIALLSAYLADQLRRTDIRLEQNRASLEDLRTLHENIVSSIQSGLITVNRNRQITFFNRFAEQITGYQKHDVLYQDITRFFTDLKQIFLNEDKLVSQHEELTCQLLGGSLAYIKWTISPLYDSRDDRIGHILIFEDVTRVRQMEEQMKRADRLATLGKLAPVIAHEIRNPLASISGSIQLLSHTLELDHDDRRLMEIVHRETEALNQWITDFLMYARPRRGERVPVDVRSMLSDSLIVLKHDKKSETIEVELTASEDECWVLADPTYLKQVVWNILNNAVQAMPKGGRLDVQIRSLDDQRGEFHRLRFRDTGSGIAPEALDRVFEPFFTTKAEGTGLGLPTVHRIVTEHGGDIAVRSELGQGTTFTVDLPRYPRPASQGTGSPATPAGIVASG